MAIATLAIDPKETTTAGTSACLAAFRTEPIRKLRSSKMIMMSHIVHDTLTC